MEQKPDEGRVAWNEIQSSNTTGSPHLPLKNLQNKDGSYHPVPNAELGGGAASPGYPSPAFSSPGWTSSTFTPSSTTFKDPDEAKQFNDMREQDVVLKRRIRRLRFILRLTAMILALYMIITMSVTFHKFFTTRNTMLDVDSTTRRGPWAKESKTWPTTLLLTTSTLSFLVSAMVMAAYVRSVRAANLVSEYGTFVGAVILAAHAGLWIAVAIAYRAGKERRDLWGWTCDDGAQQIQGTFTNVINFRELCDLQTSSWAASLIEAIVMVLYVVVYMYGYLRLKGQREMGSRFGHAYEHREGRWSRSIPTLRSPRH